MTKILIIGGGAAGVMCAAGLRAKDATTEIILVEPKNYFELVLFAFRTPFDEDDRDTALEPLRPWAVKHNIRLIHSIVTKLTPTSADLADGQTIEFDLCMVATGAGSQWTACGRGPTAPASMEERKAQLKLEGDRLVNAESVLIVGGGLIGCELAGEIAYTQKKRLGKTNKITLVQSRPHLCAETDDSVGDWIQRKLEAKGVKVIVNDKVIESDDGKFVTKNSGVELDASEVVHTTGLRPVNSFMDAKFLNDKGWIEVDDYFRVKGAGGTVFAIGDCCALLYSSFAQIQGNLDTIVANMDATMSKVKSGATADASLEADADLQAKLKKHEVAPSGYFVALGKDDGVFNIGWFTTQWIFPWFKNTKMIGMIMGMTGTQV
uniref:FAD/NAD(P)-binding domain-containing protein n=1 Tax=Craspedostauros australis TaxID=1486917 RepID=A0A6T6EQ99_9STRA|mmetsp:Transcript_14063/g.38650  ORF Transcript_14063/g.38650 Transcript_14063/m.38650 type:complete len:378 (+) Transcript_14063:113-1246(+)